MNQQQQQIKLDNVFVTVGSTQFDYLIENLLDESTLQTLLQLGCRNLVVQHGRFKNVHKFKWLHSWSVEKINVELFDYCSCIEPYIDQASLVIGHAGAGTVLEVLRKEKPLLIVINDTLMDNHQQELAQELADSGYAMCTKPSQLQNALQSLDLSKTKVFPKHNPQLFANFIKKVYGSRK